VPRYKRAFRAAGIEIQAFWTCGRASYQCYTKDGNMLCGHREDEMGRPAVILWIEELNDGVPYVV